MTVSDANDAPVITSDGGGGSASVGVAENTTAVTTVVASDQDVPAQTLTYSISGGVDSVLFAIDPSSGALSFVAAPDFESPADSGADNVYDVDVRVSDGTLTDTQQVAVTVSDANDAPVITSDGGGGSASVGVAENTTAVTTVVASDQDVPAQTLTYSISGGVDSVLFAIDPSSGALSFVAAPDFESPADSGADNVYDVDVRVSDGTLTDTQQVAVTVSDANDAPVITSDGGGGSASVGVAENTTAVTTVVASDQDVPAQTLTYSISGGVDSVLFAIDPSSGALSFVAAPDFESPADSGADNVYDVDVRVSDGTLTDTQQVAVTVSGDNDNTPVITSGGGGDTAAVNVGENQSAVMTVTATDADLPAQTLTYSISGGVDSVLFTIDPSSGALSFVAAPDFESPSDSGTDNVYDVDVQVSDGTFTDTQQIAVTVTAESDNAPVITSDGGGDTAAVNVPENSAAVTTVSATDADLPAQTLTYSISGGVDSVLFTIDPSSGALSFVAAPDFESPSDSGANNVYDVDVRVSDGALTDTQQIAVTVTDVYEAPPNEAPRITFAGGGPTADVSVPENSTEVGVVEAVDPEGTSLSFAIVDGVDARLFRLDSATGALGFLVAPDFEVPTDANGDGIYELEVGVSDGLSDARQAIAIRVTDVNEAPRNTMPARVETKEGTPVTFGRAAGNGISVADPDHDASVRVTLSVASGRLTLAARSGITFVVGDGTGDESMSFVGPIEAVNTALDGLVYTPAENANGPVELTIVSADPDAPGLEDRGNIEILVKPVNDPPVLDPIPPQRVQAGTLLTFTARATDPDGPRLRFSLVGAPDGASIAPVTGEFTWTPPAAFDEGSYNFVVVVEDGGEPVGSDRATAAVTVTVAPPTDTAPTTVPAAAPEVVAAPDAPSTEARDDHAKGTSGEPLTIDILANDTISGRARVEITVGRAKHGTVRVLADGRVVYTSTRLFAGTDRFPYTIAQAGRRSSAMVEVKVERPLDLGPVLFANASFSRPLLGKSGAVDQQTLTQEAEGTLQVGFTAITRALLDTLKALNVPARLFVMAGAWFGFLGFMLLVYRRRKAFVVEGVTRMETLEVYDRPGGSPLFRLGFDDGPVWAVGRKVKVDGRAWIRVKTPAGRGFVERERLLALDQAVDSPTSVIGSWH